METITKEMINSVKGKGFLYNKGTDAFSARIITENGVLNDQQLQVVSTAAKKFGNGNVALTVRLTLEIAGIPFHKILEFTEYMESNGLKTGGTGAKVRPIVACKGTTCSNGLCDTLSIATEIHKRFFEGYGNVALPHKFKIALGGCPNNCVKPDLNDFGMVAIISPKVDYSKCRGCKKCSVIEECPLKIVELRNNVISIDSNKCNSCGSCIDKCAFGVIKGTDVKYKIYIGGRWGKQTRMGSLLQRTYSKEDALDLMEKAILLFKKEGLPKERFGDMIDRIGLNNTEDLLNSNKLFEEKNSILNIETKVETKC